MENEKKKETSKSNKCSVRRSRNNKYVFANRKIGDELDREEIDVYFHQKSCFHQ